MARVNLALSAKIRHFGVKLSEQFSAARTIVGTIKI